MHQRNRTLTGLKNIECANPEYRIAIHKKYYRITAVNILERNGCNMKKRWLILAVAFLMVFAFIPQAALPVLAEEEITLDQIEA